MIGIVIVLVSYWLLECYWMCDWFIVLCDGVVVCSELLDWLLCMVLIVVMFGCEVGVYGLCE